MENVASDMKYGKDVRLYDMSGWIRACFQHYNDAHFHLQQDVQRRFFHASFAEAATTLLRDGAAYAWFLFLASSGAITVGEFVLACGAVASFSTLVTQISNSVGQVMQAVPPLDRMRAFLDAADEPEPERPAAPPAKDVPLSIEFEDVCFSYGGRNPVLSHFSLRIAPGEKIALVGLNGAGKTTLIKLLCGFYKPESGRILLGGTDIAAYRKADLYALVASVFQEATILPFTVAENIAMTDEGVDRGRVEDCLRQAGLWDAVCRLPRGMDTGMTSVEEGGVSLSGGQRQRLLMARALYKGAQLLFFDEPTAALDPVSEHEVYNGFRELVGSKTAIFISHRLSSCRFCDEILVFDGGRLVQQGSHDELVGDESGLYHAMWQAQAQYYAEDRILFA